MSERDKTMAERRGARVSAALADTLPPCALAHLSEPFWYGGPDPDIAATLASLASLTAGDWSFRRTADGYEALSVGPRGEVRAAWRTTLSDAVDAVLDREGE